MEYGVPEVLVLGDIMLDRYTDVDVKSAAVESNALIVLDQGTRSVLGGAANVAANLTGLGRRVQLFGLVGRDDAGLEAMGRLINAEVNWKTVWEVGGYRTTVRHRFLSPYGQLLRVDRDGGLPLRRVLIPGGDNPDPVVRFEAELAAALGDGFKVVVVSDYTQGYCDPSVLWKPLLEANRAGRPILVDPPRNGAWHDYAFDTTVFKPNVRQAANFLKSLYPGSDYRLKYKDLGVPETGFGPGTCDRRHAVDCCTRLLEAVRSEMLQRQMPFMYLWLTVGQDGALLANADARSPVLHLPGHPVEVADVTGAGDTAMAVLAYHLYEAKSYDWGTFIQGVTQANVGAAVAVSHRGTYRLTAAALRDAIKVFGGKDGKTEVAEAKRDPQPLAGR